MEVLASWQGRLRLYKRAGSGDEAVFVVDEFDENGLVTASQTYQHEHLFAAIHAYNSRWLGTLNPESAQAARATLEVSYAMGDRDIEALSALLVEEFVFVDHRGIGYPELSRMGLIEATVANADSRSRWLLTTPHAANSSGSVITGGFWTENFSEWYRFEFGTWVSFVEDNKVTRIELFPEDRLDEALERFG